MSNTPALLAASAGVAVGHAILPDHWVPLATIGRTRRYPLARVARLSGLAGVAHVFVSLALGGVIVLVGLQFRSRVQDAQDTIVGALLIATGIGFLVAEALGHGRSHAQPHPHPGRQGHPHAHPHGGGRIASLASVMVPFGAAASPDLTILPVFLAATTAGAGTAIASLVVFGAVTIVTIVALTLLATIGGYQIRGRWLDRWGNVVTAAVLAVIGGLVLAGVI